MEARGILEVCCEKQAVMEMKDDIISDLDNVASLSDIISLGYLTIKSALASAVYSEGMTKDEADECAEIIAKLLKVHIEEAEQLRLNYKHNGSERESEAL